MPFVTLSSATVGNTVLTMCFESFDFLRVHQVVRKVVSCKGKEWESGEKLFCDKVSQRDKIKLAASPLTV